MVISHGTDNAIYRLGEDFSVRLPRIHWAADDAEKESGVGDPACDLIAAWSIFTPATREHFRTSVSVDDATWARGRGWAKGIKIIKISKIFRFSNLSH